MVERKIVLTFNDGTTKEIILADDERFEVNINLYGSRLSVTADFPWDQPRQSGLLTAANEVQNKTIAAVKYLIDNVIVLEKSGTVETNYSVLDMRKSEGLVFGYGTETFKLILS